MSEDSQERTNDLEENFEDDDLKEEDLVRAFAKISQIRRESSISISDACRLFSRQPQHTRYNGKFHLGD